MSLLGASFSAVLQQQAAAIATQQVVTQTVQATAVQVVDPVTNTPAPIASTHLADTTSLVRQSELTRVAMKDEANTFSEIQTIDNLVSGHYNVGTTIDKHEDDIQDNKQKLTRVENTSAGLRVNSDVIATAGASATTLQC